MLTGGQETGKTDAIKRKNVERDLSQVRKMREERINNAKDV